MQPLYIAKDDTDGDENVHVAARAREIDKPALRACP